MKLPEEFALRMKDLLGDEYGDFLKTYEEPRRFGLRVNTLKIQEEELERLVPFSLERLSWIPGGYRYDKSGGDGSAACEPSRHPFYYAGLYYLQEPSAMTPASALPVVPGDRVLDLCAAPGGKATALAARLQGRGLLVANDISASRARALLKNLEVFGVTNAFVTNAVPARLAEQFGAYFDKILVDAPCSGEGMFRKDAANARAWSLDKVTDCARIQKDLVLQAASMLRPGGMMVYSTCTFSPEENEQVIAHLLRERPEMELCGIPWQEGFAHGRPELCAGPRLEEIRRCVRIFPHRMGGEGHFLALLRKKSTDFSGQEADPAQSAGRPLRVTDQTRSIKKKAHRKKGGRPGRAAVPDGAPSPEEWRLLEEFLRDVTMEYRKDQIEIRKGQVYLVPERFEWLQGIAFLRNGLYLGEIRKDRFEPSQSFAMALKSGEYASVLNFDWRDERVNRYLRGETIETEETAPARAKGWQLVCVNGYPLGWGRLVNGTLKNKYHSGWRMQN